MNSFWRLPTLFIIAICTVVSLVSQLVGIHRSLRDPPLRSTLLATIEGGSVGHVVQETKCPNLRKNREYVRQLPSTE